MNEQSQLIKTGKKYTDSIIERFTAEILKFHPDKEKTSTLLPLTGDLNQNQDNQQILSNAVQ